MRFTHFYGGGVIDESCLIKLDSTDSLLCRHNVVISNARYLFICAFCLFFWIALRESMIRRNNDRKRVQIRTQSANRFNIEIILMQVVPNFALP